MKKRLLCVSLLAAVSAILAGIAVGSIPISVKDIVEIAFCKIAGLPIREQIANNASIVWDLRVPRVALAFLVGAALSVSGAIVQSVLKNPLASPFTLGVSSGASLGAGLIIVTGFSLPVLGGFTLPVIGFIGAVATIFLALGFASRVDKSLSNNTIVLTGMVLSLFFNALLMVLSAFARQSMQRITVWQMGTFATKGWTSAVALLPFVLACLVWSMFYTKEMDMLTFGEEQAKSMGVDTKKTKRRLLVIAAVFAGSAVSMSGIIGFVDLVVPHIVRRLFGSKHAHVLPLSAVVGGTFMVLADLVARIVVPPFEMPLGAITALIGAPFFVYLYFKQSR